MADQFYLTSERKFNFMNFLKPKKRVRPTLKYLFIFEIVQKLQFERISHSLHQKQKLKNV